VARGQQASYTLVITPTGANGSFTFACGTLPSNAICIFNPTSESLSAGVQGNVEVEISTSNGSAASVDRPALWHIASLVCGLLLLPLALSKRRRIFLLIVTAVTLAGGVSSCTSSGGGTSSGSSGQGGGSGTPASTYTIPVSVTATGVTQQVNLTLTVD
jgi:hypothetical protein